MVHCRSWMRSKASARRVTNWERDYRRGNGGQKTGNSARHFNHINLTALAGMKFKGNVAAVRRPAWSSGGPVQRSELLAVGTVAIARPDAPEAQAIGFERNLFPVG